MKQIIVGSCLMLSVMGAGFGLAGCGADVGFPAADKIEVKNGTTVIASITPSRTSDTTITEDVPVNSSFAITFSEPMKLDSVKSKIRIKNANNETATIDITQRLEVANIALLAPLKPNLNHVIEIDNGIEDSTGNKSIQAYKVNFYTVP